MSIHGFSQPCKELAVWAADNTHQPHEVRSYLTSRNIWFIPCLGGYKGETELSYLTSWADFLIVAPLFCTGQETVLRLGNMDSLSRRKATLIPLDPLFYREVDLGHLYSIPASDIHKHDDWTIPLQQPPGGINAFVCGFPDKFGQIVGQL